MDDTIKTVGDLRNLISDLSDDYVIRFEVRRKVPGEELVLRSYKYPYDCYQFDGIEFDDIGVSDKVLCLGVELENLPKP